MCGLSLFIRSDASIIGTWPHGPMGWFTYLKLLLSDFVPNFVLRFGHRVMKVLWTQNLHMQLRLRTFRLSSVRATSGSGREPLMSRLTMFAFFQ